MKLSFRKAAVGAALLAAAGLGAGLTAGLASASGPYFPQGTVVHECINLFHENETYFELHSSALGNCAAGYEQISLTADPDNYAISSGTSGTADVVTVTYPGAQTATEGEAFDLKLSATSSQGHGVSWALTSSPAGLAGAGELEINTATGEITGTPGVTGTYSLTATATDTTGASGSTTFSVTIGS